MIGPKLHVRNLAVSHHFSVACRITFNNQKSAILSVVNVSKDKAIHFVEMTDHMNDGILSTLDRPNLHLVLEGLNVVVTDGRDQIGIDPTPKVA